LATSLITAIVCRRVDQSLRVVPFRQVVQSLRVA